MKNKDEKHMDCTKQNYVDGKVIIITGASSGFGRAAARKAAVSAES